MAIRQALGAPRMRLICQLLTESLLLSLLGGIAGMAVLFFTRKLLLEMIPTALPRLNDISINWTVTILPASTYANIAGIFFGLAPALQASRQDPIHVLRQEGRGSKGSKKQTWTLSAFNWLPSLRSVVLLIAAGTSIAQFLGSVQSSP